MRLTKRTCFRHSYEAIFSSTMEWNNRILIIVLFLKSLITRRDKISEDQWLLERDRQTNRVLIAPDYQFFCVLFDGLMLLYLY
jgi:hypothetical protein